MAGIRLFQSTISHQRNNNHFLKEAEAPNAETATVTCSVTAAVKCSHAFICLSPQAQSIDCVYLPSAFSTSPWTISRILRPNIAL